MASKRSTDNLKNNVPNGTIVFPEGAIDTEFKYIRFAARPLLKLFDGVQAPTASDETKVEIILPIPSGLSDSTAYTFSADGLGGFAGPLIEALKRNSDLKGVVGDSRLLSDYLGRGGLLAGQALGDLLDSKALASSFIGAANPYLKNNFQGVGFKSHQFSFFMSPRNKKDSRNVKNIVDAFKYYSAPVGRTEPIMDVKYIFDITIEPPDVARYLFRFKPCYLTDFSVSYNNTGVSAFHSDGAPMDVAMSMTFTEIEIQDALFLEQSRAKDIDAFRADNTLLGNLLDF